MESSENEPQQINLTLNFTITNASKIKTFRALLKKDSMLRWKFRMCVKLAFFSFSLLQTAIIPGCSSTKELNSELLSGTYNVDGHADKWNGKKMLDLKDAG